MSWFGNVFRGAVIVGGCFLVGFPLSARGQFKHDLKINQSQLKDLKSQYSSESKKHPSVKTVTTSYQKAMNVGNQFLTYQNQLHAIGKTTGAKATMLTNEMNSIVGNAGQLSMPLIPFDIKDWHAKLFYGGQTSDSQIALGYRVYNKLGSLMSLTTFNYNDSNGKLSGFITYPTYAGQKQIQQSLLDPASSIKGGHHK